ncbi:Uncharacterized metal-binding protein [Methanococcoides vulcani]|uniref:Uncharacterized metal-binding protein n=1 Tax=Methanococcoides vulcani TaxID=1353158 RepID=A0A1H9Z9L9_9EURY|nr:DUF1847 domain-containing protein [Methanococcoides vulcani]SES78036.1 Uncharacterized metal-binding protein [Methanococcoides vulcani]
MKCASCDTKRCRQGKDCTPAEVQAEYRSEDLEMMKVASKIEANFYMEKTRLEELILFAKEMGYRKLGVAFCVGLENEARTFCRILEKDFIVESVCCKICGVDKEEYGLDKIRDGRETTCNPIAQAMMLNRAETDLNIIVGLCMGHDIMFNKYSEAPVTTFIVKDRVLAHNPAGALYSGYYLKNRFGMEKM